jgi:hypothetical protein
MAEHEDVGVFIDLLTSKNIWFTKEIDNEVKGMNVQVDEGITLGICSRQIMQVVVDEVLFAQSLLEKLHGGGISLL